MAAPNDLETDVPIGNFGDSSPDTVAVFTDALKEFGGIDLTAGLVAPPAPGAFARCKAGTNNHAYGLGVDSGLPGSILVYTHCFGMEVGEWVSWYFNGGGDALIDGLLTTADPTNPYFLPVLTRTAEGCGWFKEAITHKKLTDGLYADGAQIKLRQFGEGKPAMNYAYPNVVTPPVTTGVSFLGDIASGVFNGGEYNEPYGDASQINGLFPNWPLGTGGIIDLGMKHYYMSSWHTPARVRNIWINRTVWAALTAAQKNWYKYAAMASCLENIAISHNGQDAIVKQFQALGCVIHEHLPVDVLKALGEATVQAQDVNAAADGTGAYQAIVDHQRAFIVANNVRWRSGNINRRLRFQRTSFNASFQPNVKL